MMRPTRRRMIVGAGALAGATLAGCTTAGDARRAEGSGERRIYPVSSGAVWDVLDEAVAAAGLDAAAGDPDDGVLIAEHGVSLFSFGERVAVFVRPLGGERTEVEVVSKATVATNVLANDWSDDIFAELDRRLP